MVKLVDLINFVEWGDVLSELKREELLADGMDKDFLFLFSKLLNMEPVESSMRIIIREVKVLDWTYEEEADEMVLDIIGKNGILNKDLESFKYFEESKDPEIANAEAEFDIRATPWERWLGMDLDMETFNNRSVANIVSVCMWGMTLESFDEYDLQIERERIAMVYNEFKALSTEQKLEEIKKWRGFITSWEKKLLTW